MAKPIHSAVGEQFARGDEKTVKLGRSGYRHGEIPYTVEAVSGIPYDLILQFIPRLIHTLKHPCFVVRDIRADIDVLEEIERSRYGKRVLETRLPIAEEIGMQNFFFLDILHRDTALKGISEGDFLVPTFISHRFFSFEWFGLTQVERKLWQLE